jgi:hypothetical protein
MACVRCWGATRPSLPLESSPAKAGRWSKCQHAAAGHRDMVRSPAGQLLRRRSHAAALQMRHSRDRRQCRLACSCQLPAATPALSSMPAGCNTIICSSPSAAACQPPQRAPPTRLGQQPLEGAGDDLLLDRAAFAGAAHSSAAAIAARAAALEGVRALEGVGAVGRAGRLRLLHTSRRQGHVSARRRRCSSRTLCLGGVPAQHVRGGKSRLQPQLQRAGTTQPWCNAGGGLSQLH